MLSHCGGAVDRRFDRPYLVLNTLRRRVGVTRGKGDLDIAQDFGVSERNIFP